MSNFFDGLKTYGGKWSLKNECGFTDEEKSMVKGVRVVDSDYGLSACFLMSSGYTTYVPMSTDANVCVGQVLDIDKCKILTLGKAGEKDIHRIGY